MERLRQKQEEAKSEKGMKDSERVQEKCQTVSQRVGEGPSTAPQELRSRPWHCSQGEHNPPPGVLEEGKEIPRELAQKEIPHP